MIIYSCGLFLGSYFYKYAQSQKLNNILAITDKPLLELFSYNVCTYLALFLIVLFLGFCMLGFPVVNAVEFIVGIDYGMKISYYFINYNSKGIVYSLLMIIPFGALFLTVLAYTISNSDLMSKGIYKLTKAEREVSTFSANEYIKKYLILGIIIIAVSFVNAGLTKLLIGVVTI